MRASQVGLAQETSVLKDLGTRHAPAAAPSPIHVIVWLLVLFVGIFFAFIVAPPSLPQNTEKRGDMHHHHPQLLL